MHEITAGRLTPGTIGGALIDNKNAEMDRLNGIYMRILKNNNVDLHEGRGVLEDEHTVNVDGKKITAENILIAVGGWPLNAGNPWR